MNEYRIQSMKLLNFCGIQSLEIKPDGADLSIFGDNATGKTTIANAFAWLFTGKNASGTADFDPAPLDSSNAKIHNLETSVTVRFTDGTEYRRVLTEVWTKKRGEVTAQFTGTKTAYYKDDVPLKEKEFNADVDSLFGGAEQFRMLTAVGYFPAVMDWKARRKLLLDMCGDVRDEDVIASTPEISELPGLLNGHTVDDYLKVAKSRKAAVKKELDTIPARITENENAASGAEAQTTAVETEIAELEQHEKDIAEKLLSHTPSAAGERRNALKRELENRRTEYLSDYNKRVSAYNTRLSELTEKRDELSSQRSPLLVKKSSLPRQIDEMKKLNQQFHECCDEIRTREYTGGDTCPCCGQKLPPEQVEKAAAEFDKRKSEELSAIVSKAKTTCHRDMISALESELETITARVSELDEKYNAVEEELEALRNSKPVSAFEQTPEYSKLTEQIKEAFDIGDGINQIVIAALEADRKGTAEQLAAAKEKLYKARATQDIRKRIAELEAQQKSLAAEYAQCEKGEYLCEQFIRAKVSMLDERINSRFRTLRFKLFHEQQNGGLQEICKVLIPCESGLVEYEKANSAARINAGIEIVNVLGEYFGVRLPVFCDNAESVTALTPSDGQAVRLIVSEADKALRFET